MGQLLKMIRADYLIDAFGFNKIQGASVQSQRDCKSYQPRPGGLVEWLARSSRKDFITDQEVRWCPGCGDYAILAAVQKTMPEFGIAPENIRLHFGDRMLSRFPYYMNTYGFHTIHGRAPAFATGLKITRPELDVWVVTGDGDGLSIGGNHLIHVLRRNVDLKILLLQQ